MDEFLQKVQTAFESIPPALVSEGFIAKFSGDPRPILKYTKSANTGLPKITDIPVQKLVFIQQYISK